MAAVVMPSGRVAASSWVMSSGMWKVERAG